MAIEALPTVEESIVLAQEVTGEKPVEKVAEVPVKVELTAEQLEEKQAIEFYKALRDPKQGPELIKFLAQQAGLSVTAETKPTEVKKDILEALKEEAGDYGFLIEKIGPGLKKMIDEAVNTQVSGIKQTFAAKQEDEFKTAYDGAWDKLNTDSEGLLEKNGAKIAELTKDYPYTPSKTNTISKYLSNLLKLATDGEEDSKTEKVLDKIKKNAKEGKVPSSDVDEARIEKGPQYPSIEDAIMAAGKTLGYTK